MKGDTSDLSKGRGGITNFIYGGADERGEASTRSLLPRCFWANKIGQRATEQTGNGQWTDQRPLRATNGRMPSRDARIHRRKGKLSGQWDRQDHGNERNRRHRLRLRVNEGHNRHSNNGIGLLHAAILFIDTNMRIVYQQSGGQRGYGTNDGL